MRLIDADALTEFFKARMALWSSVDEVLDVISDAPAIEAEPVRRGRWKQIKAYPDLVFCDECGEPFKRNSNEERNYCSHCGARMEVDE